LDYDSVTEAPALFPTQEWHQYVVTRNGATIQLFIDGNLIVTNDSTPVNHTSSPNPLLIGKRNQADGRDFPVNGLLDDVAIWSRALSVDEIKSLHDNGFQPSARIVFSSTRNDPMLHTLNTDIYSMKDDGSDLKRLTTHPAIDATPAWSPDRTKIAFSSNRGGNNFDIYIMNADGSGQIQLTTDRAIDTTPTWSPDGKKIAFASNRGGNNFDIYIMDAADGSGQTPLTAATNPGLPDISPDW
jgi:TolB protein